MTNFINRKNTRLIFKDDCQAVIKKKEINLGLITMVQFKIQKRQLVKSL